MSPLQRRVKNVVRSLGDSFTVIGATRYGIFRVLSRGQALIYLPVATVDAATLPIRTAYVSFDDATALSDSVSWDGLALTVAKVVNARWRGEAVAKLLVLV